MPRKDTIKAQVAFQDVSSCFSQEEWKLLQEWQRELYSNVMKEIHQALVSLGPIIATTVYSLRVKEKEEPRRMDCENSEEMERVNHSRGDNRANFDMHVKRHKGLPSQMNSQQRSEGREPQDFPGIDDPYVDTNICMRNEDAVSVYIDHLCTEMGETRNERNSEYEIVSFPIKEEEEAYTIGHQENKRTESFNSLIGDEIINHKAMDAVKHFLKTTAAKASSGRARVKVVPSYEKGVHSRQSLWPDIFQEGAGGENDACESCFNGPNNLHQGNLNVQISETYSDSSDLFQANLVSGPPNLQETMNLYSCTQCEKSFHKKEYLYRHKRTHMGVRPYQCGECKKSFRRKDTLLVHRRTHTGERPYHCPVCEKSFNQVGALHRHLKTHMGHRPYQCHQCEKSFSQNGTLIAHQKIHNSLNNRSPSQV